MIRKAPGAAVERGMVYAQGVGDGDDEIGGGRDAAHDNGSGREPLWVPRKSMETQLGLGPCRTALGRISERRAEEPQVPMARAEIDE